MSLSESDLERLKQKLEAEREAAEEKLREGGYTLKENAGYGDHPADAATDVVVQMTSHGILEIPRQKLREISAALRRIDNRTYGRCEICGEFIPFDRLELVSWTRYCARCAS